jgi:hypothetical protein
MLERGTAEKKDSVAPGAGWCLAWSCPTVTATRYPGVSPMSMVTGQPRPTHFVDGWDPAPSRPGRAVVQVRTTRSGLVPSRVLRYSLRSVPRSLRQALDGGRFGWSGAMASQGAEATAARTDDGPACPGEG